MFNIFHSMAKCLFVLEKSYCSFSLMISLIAAKNKITCQFHICSFLPQWVRPLCIAFALFGQSLNSFIDEWVGGREWSSRPAFFFFNFSNSKISLLPADIV